jgi:hypothetical protein
MRQNDTPVRQIDAPNDAPERCVRMIQVDESERCARMMWQVDASECCAKSTCQKSMRHVDAVDAMPEPYGRAFEEPRHSTAERYGLAMRQNDVPEK